MPCYLTLRRHDLVLEVLVGSGHQQTRVLAVLAVEPVHRGVHHVRHVHAVHVLSVQRTLERELRASTQQHTHDESHHTLTRGGCVTLLDCDATRQQQDGKEVDKGRGSSVAAW